jgi:probable F420-dependent oxidoreductase
MREFVLAIRAIWDTWATGAPLDFHGDFYSHTLMTPFFDPGPNPHGTPKVMIAGVGPLMTEVAGEVADGLVGHGFTTERYLREVTLPAVARGRAKAGKTMEGFELSLPAFIVARDSEEDIAAGTQFVKQQIGFYGSTPAYRAVLELHGWGDLHVELHAATKRREWDRLPGLVDDDVLAAFAVIGRPEAAFAELHRRYGDVATRVAVSVPEDRDPERWAALFDSLRRGPPEN